MLFVNTRSGSIQLNKKYVYNTTNIRHIISYIIFMLCVSSFFTPIFCTLNGDFKEQCIENSFYPREFDNT